MIAPLKLLAPYRGNLLDLLVFLLNLSLAPLLIYFPPRMVYLVEDLKRPLTWLTLLLANLPMLARILFGFN
jgi:hypothetical protein